MSAGRGILSLMIKYVNLLLRPIYKIYEKWLWLQISGGPIPKHVAIIPDGNRRWAKEKGMPMTYGHEIGYDRLRDVLRWLLDLDVKVITIYAMSYENCIFRSEDEKKHLFNLLEKALNDLMSSDIIYNERINIRVFGRLDMIPRELLDKIREVEEVTKNYSNRFINVALCYGGRQEIIDAARKLIYDVINGKVDVNELSEETFRKYLYTSHLDDVLDEPDLVIRTSGELRLSNFLLWQIAYSELYFCDVFWPEFRRIDLWRAIRSYQRRERRFGK